MQTLQRRVPSFWDMPGDYTEPENGINFILIMKSDPEMFIKVHFLVISHAHVCVYKFIVFCCCVGNALSKLFNMLYIRQINLTFFSDEYVYCRSTSRSSERITARDLWVMFSILKGFSSLSFLAQHFS